jgi:hypothetical protein
LMISISSGVDVYTAATLAIQSALKTCVYWS